MYLQQKTQDFFQFLQYDQEIDIFIKSLHKVKDLLDEFKNALLIDDSRHNKNPRNLVF